MGIVRALARVEGRDLEACALAAECGSRPRVLVVDDSVTIRNYLLHLLGGETSCVAVESATEAMAAALAEEPDLIISDVVMEPIDGYGLCRMVRAEPKLRDVPFVLLTTNGDSDARAAGLEEGADDYLSKPVRPRELLARVRSLVRLRRAQKEIVRHKNEIAAAHENLLAAQKQLFEAERLATLGTLASGVAHEINNSLCPVMAGINDLADLAMALAGESDPDRKRALLEEVAQIQADALTGTERIRAIVRQLGHLATGRAASDAPLDFRAEVERALAIARPRLEGVEVKVLLGHTACVASTPGSLAQVLTNLLLNAGDAVGGEVQPRVEVRTLDVDGGIEVAVEDNGSGIPSEKLGRIFEPFYTTRSAGSGAGLGLAVCSSLVGRAGGRIQAASVPTQGSIFYLWLPARETSAAARFNASRASEVSNVP